MDLIAKAMFKVQTSILVKLLKISQWPHKKEETAFGVLSYNRKSTFH